MSCKPLLQLSPALCVAVLISSCGNPNTTKLANGLQVTYTAAEPSDMADILDLKMYRFNVVFPASGQSLDCNLELRRKGQAPQSIAGIITGPHVNGQTTVLVGLHPLGDSWSKSDQIKTYIKTAGQFGGSSTENIKKNPFKNSSQMSYGDVGPLQDGGYLLLYGEEGKTKEPHSPATSDIQMVLTFTPKNIKYPQ